MTDQGPRAENGKSDPLESRFKSFCDLHQIKAEPHDTISGLDFYLPDHNCYVELKAYHSERIGRQMASQQNIILIQGMPALDVFINLVEGRWK